MDSTGSGVGDHRTDSFAVVLVSILRSSSGPDMTTANDIP
jgi:hypothetical protein